MFSYDRESARVRPCFAMLPWDTLKKGDRIHLEIWAPDNHSKFFTFEQAVTYLKAVEKLRDLEFKVVVEKDKVFTIHWYHNQLQTFSGLTLVRYAAEDNWNEHHLVAEHVLATLGKIPLMKAIEEGHFLQKEKGQHYNSGHALLYHSADMQFTRNKGLKSIKHPNNAKKSINEFWSFSKKKL